LQTVDYSYSPKAVLHQILIGLCGTISEKLHIRKPFTRVVRSAESNDALSPQDIADSKYVIEMNLSKMGGGKVVSYIGGGVFTLERRISGNPLVSIIIPTQGIRHPGETSCFVERAVASIIESTSYENYEIVVVLDESADTDVISELKLMAHEKLRLVRWRKPFNFSQKMNFGVLHARGDYVLLLNDDVEIMTEEWLGSMLALAQQTGAGMVGSLLYYEDESIQHAGHVYTAGIPTHAGLNRPRDAQGPLSSYLVEREVSGVTAACSLMPTEVFMRCGGFTPLLPGNFNDVDLCLKVGWLNMPIVWTPSAKLFHFESKTRDARVHFYELDTIQGRWAHLLDDSRFWPWAPAA
jgi:glycosyltransferase involved in cell wall biosynthesis